MTQSEVFTADNFRDPVKLFPKDPSSVRVVHVPVTNVRCDEDLAGYGHLVERASDFVTQRTSPGGRFEIRPWPTQGWRSLDPDTGDEAGVTEGDFKVEWKGNCFFGENLAIASANNTYLDGLGTLDWTTASAQTCPDDAQGEFIALWMSDYHPDGGQLFFPKGEPVEFYVCLGLKEYGDDIKPGNMRGFRIPKGNGVYIHPGTWHNGIYTSRKHGPRTFFTRQGRVHARVSCSWVKEFNTILKLPMENKCDRESTARASMSLL